MDFCPFCGVATEVPHEPQEMCIEALHAEIARMRDVLNHTQSVEVPELREDTADEEPPSGN